MIQILGSNCHLIMNSMGYVVGYLILLINGTIGMAFLYVLASVFVGVGVIMAVEYFSVG